MNKAGLVAPVVLLSSLSAADFYLKPEDRVVFYGDSITEQRLYTTYVETFVRTRYPGLKVAFFPCGIGGDTTWGGWTGASDERVRRDVKPRKPTVVTIMLGMNDGGYVPFDPKIFAVFQEWYGKLLGWMRAAAPSARLTLIGSSPYDDLAHPNTDFKGYDQTVGKFASYVKELAAKEKLGFVDFHLPVNSFVSHLLEVAPKDAASVLPDGIHPGPNGHLVMASQLLQAWRANGVVSTVEIDGNAGRLVSAEGSTVTGLKSLSWSQKDACLPFPFDPSYALAWKYSSFNADLNRQILKVYGLDGGRYSLSIDGKPVGAFTAVELAAGVNLAELETPMRAQASQVLQAVVKRNEALFTQWHRIEFGFAGYPSTPAVSAALGKLVGDIDQEIAKLSKPVAHRFAITPAKSGIGPIGPIPLFERSEPRPQTPPASRRSPAPG